ncbi:MAG TPA: FG-GAP-like repeat-containing protein [Blastocatellia bacterium]|nr:FG-GAP-like repeat-containing protein [Blastocatellia bacterium]
MNRVWIRWMVAALCVAIAVFAGWRLLRKTYTVAQLDVPTGGTTGFTRMAPDQTGISFVNELTDEHAGANRVLNNGSGVALGDFDNDGRCDIYFCRLDGDNVLYRNLGGWKFEDVTARAGVGLPNTYATGATFADIDGDGDLDLLVASLPGLRCFSNNGDGTFADATSAAGLVSGTGNMSLALADIDGDGDLDLYVASYRKDSIKDSDLLKLQMVNGKLTIPPNLRDRLNVVNGSLNELGEPDALYVNDGKGHFTAVSWTGGAFLDEDGERLAQPPLDWGLTATFRDINGDGLPDLYVCNDFISADTIWINQGAGKFRALDRLAMRKMSATSMGVDFSDIDRDGNVDFFVVDMLSREHKRRNMQMLATKVLPNAIGEIENRPQVAQNTLFHSRGDGTFEEIANYAGVAASDWSWATLFFDIDLDGYEDLFVANGHSRDVQDGDTNARIDAMNPDTVSVRDTYRLYPRLETPNAAYRNLGNLKFDERAKDWGLDAAGISNGAALGDLDGDGDLDLVVNNFQSPAGVYRNDSSAPRVAVRLVGNSSNVQGVGAKVVVTGGPVQQSKEIACGGGYLSGSDPLAVFAAGSAPGGMTIEVTWRDGSRSTVMGVLADHLYTVYESGAGSGRATPASATAPAFKDASDLIRHTHREDEFDDFARQALLPNRLSRTGPGVAWADVDGDGDDDLVVASGSGGAAAIYVNNGNGTFAQSGAASPSVVDRDETSVLVWPQAPGATTLLLGLSNFEDARADGEAVARAEYQNGAFAAAPGVPAQPSSTGPMAMADVDGDGDLDLFVGGRTVPGRYPEPASSMLLRNEAGAFATDASNTAVLSKIGLVSGAVFSDFDGDGDPDLVLAREWGPVTVLRNDRGSFSDATAQLGLAKFTGWWNGVSVGDFDEDGRMDLVATNWGLNTSYQVDDEHPAMVFEGGTDATGAPLVIEAYRDRLTGTLLPVRRFADVSKAAPQVAAKYSTFESYGAATLEEIYGPGVVNGTRWTANTLASTVFLNRGDHFEAVPLPAEAQMSPGFGIAVADLDGDGHDDVVIAQNFFDSVPTTPRCDSGRGIWLKGDGTGAFAAVPGQVSGIKVYGDGRAAAVSDFDGDGRVDIVVTQNGSATKLYRNIGGAPGLRVRLEAGGANPAGIGGSLRLWFGGRGGPVREIHAGSGYLSQDSAVEVLAATDAQADIEVRWPGGATTRAAVPAGAREIAVARDGSVRAVR